MEASQIILEKFEFFPIKCHVQRSADIFNIAKEHRNEAGYKAFRLKVQHVAKTLFGFGTCYLPVGPALYLSMVSQWFVRFGLAKCSIQIQHKLP
jgi:hypothetical protein